MRSNGSIFDLISRDYFYLSSLIFDIETADDPKDLLTHLTEEIKHQGTAVETVIYPKLRKIMKRENVGHFVKQEQAELTASAERLCSLALTDEAWTRDFFELKKLLLLHVNRLERRLYKKMKRLLDKRELEALCLEYIGVRDGLVRSAA